MALIRLELSSHACQQASRQVQVSYASSHVDQGRLWPAYGQRRLLFTGSGATRPRRQPSPLLSLRYRRSGESLWCTYCMTSSPAPSREDRDTELIVMLV